MSSSDVIQQIDRTLRAGKSQLQAAPGVVHLDFESRSTVPFGRSKGAVTAYQYANHPTTDVLCMSYAFGDGPVTRWDPFLTDEPFPADLAQAVRDGWIVAAHNAGFEWCIWNFLLVPRLGVPPLPIEQMDDTAARAAIMALPRSLEQACEAMKLPIQKDKEGHRLMMQMAKPRKARKGEDPTVTYWWEDEDRLLRLGRYCDQDVEAERALDKVLVPMSPLNRRDFLLVHATNMRGVQVDVDLARRAQGVMAVVEGRYCDELAELTNFMVTAPTEVAGMKAWMEQVHGVEVVSLDKPSVVRLMEEHPDPESTLNRVLHIRQEAGKSSVAKLQRFLELTHHDGRMRENFLFHGAGPGRLSGKGAQLQNLPSRTGLAWQQAEMVIHIILTYEPEAAADTIELLFGHVPEAISSCLRAHLQARREGKMYVADFSNIEGRVAAWFGNEHWKIQAFRDYDTFLFDENGNKIPDGKGDYLRLGPDLYKVTAAQILGLTPEQVDKTQRNIMGKVPELALGFGGGVGAFVSMGGNYGIDMADYWEIIQGALGGEFIQKAYDHWDLFGAKSGMQAEAWLASESVKVAWRDRHPGIVACWADAEKCAIKALKHPGRWFKFADGKLAFASKVIGGVNFLIGRMPNGRRIYKAHAKLKTVQKFGRERSQIHYWGVDSVTRNWVPMTTYGGDLFQSFVQGTAYDLMMCGWENVERDGFEVILSVHDELGAEGEPGRPVEHFEALMAELPEWAEGCPVAAAGYVADRYRKD